LHSFDFIELKMSSAAGHVLYAVIEALRYGVLYLFSRRNARDLGYVIGESGLLGARDVRLVVLAPTAYFSEAPSTWLQTLCDDMNTGLATQVARLGLDTLSMRVDLERFPDWFRWPASDNDLVRAMLERDRVCP